MFAEEITDIEDSAFNGCTGLRSISIPKNITKISSNVFNNCTGLVEIKFLETLKTIDYYAISGCNNLTEIEIPDSITGISGYAFYNCKKLSKIKMSTGWSTTDVGRSAFDGCNNLEQIWIPDSVTSIENYVFNGCSKVSVHGVKESFAESYATENNIPFSTEKLVYEMVRVNGKVIAENGTGLSGVTVSLYNKVRREFSREVITDDE